MFESNQLFAQRYLLLEKAGSGSFFEVWKAADQMTDDAVVALKIYTPEHGMEERGLRRFRREYAAILDLSHPNLLIPRQFDIWENRPYLILPYLEKGSLGTLLADSETLSERGLAAMLSQVSNALAYLHTRNVFHQLITPRNILIGPGGEYLLSDFGLSVRFRSMLRKSTSGDQNRILAYTAPESVDSTAGNHPAVDVFSLGVVTCELATGELPWDINDVMTNEADIPSVLESYSSGFGQWIAAMMSREPSSRPTAQQIADAAGQYLQKGTWPERAGEESHAQQEEDPVKRVEKESVGQSSSAEDRESERGEKSSAQEPDFPPRTEPSPNERDGQPDKSDNMKWIAIGSVVFVILLFGGLYLYNQIESRKEAERIERVYRQHIAQGDQRFASGEYSSAIDSYHGALSVRRNDTYANNRLREAEEREEEREEEEEARAAAEAEREHQRQEEARAAAEADREHQRQEADREASRDLQTAVIEVRNPRTGRVWMDRNLGASRAAISSTDTLAYGGLYQWGRATDGHQRRNSPTTTTLSRSDEPGHGNFILARKSLLLDWRNPQNDNLWQWVNGVREINNPCPPGYRLPTEAEWEEERQSWSSNNSAGAFASPLKLPLAGFRRDRSDGSLLNVSSTGFYWSSTVSDAYARFLSFGSSTSGTIRNSSNAYMYSRSRADGRSVRCIKD